MGWEQIESKWAAMTRRVRGEASVNTADATGTIQRRVAVADASASISADRSASVSADEEITMSAQ